MTRWPAPVRVVGGATAGVLALAVLPATVAPAHAVPATITAAEAVTKLRKAAAETRSASLRFGSRADMTVLMDLGGVRDEVREEVVVDPARRLTQVRVDVVDEDALEPPPGLPPVRKGNPCLVGDTGYDELELDQAGVGRYVHLGSPRPPYVKQGLRVLKRPEARWRLDRDRSLTMEASIARNDSASALIGVVTDPTYMRITSATTEPIADKGTRYTVKYTNAVPDDGSLDGSMVVDVHEGGPAARFELTEKSAFLGSPVSTSFKGRYSYDEQVLAVPVFKTVVYPKALRAGCTAALTRDTVRTTADSVAKKLNRGKGKVTTAKIRKAVKRELRKAHRAANVKKKNVDGGIRMTGRHRFIVPVVRTVVVVDGKAVVRNRR